MNQRTGQSDRRYQGDSMHQEFHAAAPRIGQACLHTELNPVTLQIVLHLTVTAFKKVGH